MNPQVWWYVARASGIIAWLLLTASVIWGVLLSTDAFPTHRRPAWLLDLHRWLGGLTVAFVAAHLAALVADSYTHFDLADLAIPYASEWRPGAVALGVVATWCLVAVEATSLAMRRLPRKLWRADPPHQLPRVLAGQPARRVRRHRPHQPALPAHRGGQHRRRRPGPPSTGSPTPSPPARREAPPRGPRRTTPRRRRCPVVRGGRRPWQGPSCRGCRPRRDRAAGEPDRSRAGDRGQPILGPLAGAVPIGPALRVDGAEYQISGRAGPDQMMSTQPSSS